MAEGNLEALWVLVALMKMPVASELNAVQHSLYTVTDKASKAVVLQIISRAIVPTMILSTMTLPRVLATTVVSLGGWNFPYLILFPC